MSTGLFLEEFEKKIGVFFFFWIAFDEQGPVLATRSSGAGGTAMDEAVGTQMETFFQFSQKRPGYKRYFAHHHASSVSI